MNQVRNERIKSELPHGAAVMALDEVHQQYRPAKVLSHDVSINTGSRWLTVEFEDSLQDYSYSMIDPYNWGNSLVRPQEGEK